jgi:hypothetical protein
MQLTGLGMIVLSFQIPGGPRPVPGRSQYR